MGKIVTFYSYKGGTGRSMALANVAWVLASNGARVLVVDWDLEAPGLHRYFRPFLADKELTRLESQGVIDLMADFVGHLATPDNPREPRDPNWYREYADISKWSKRLLWPSGQDARTEAGGTIEFVPAGRQGPQYAARVNSFDWSAFYGRYNGGAFIDAMRHSMSRYDWVLIDSRTGVSDTSGICTVQLPDILVVCFTLNYQSIEGASAIARSAQAGRKADEIRILPLPTRLDGNEETLLKAMMAYARRTFTPLMPRDLDADRYWQEMGVPYFSRYAYSEKLAPFEEHVNVATSTLPSMERLASYVTGRTVKLRPLPEGPRAEALAEFEQLPEGLDSSAREIPTEKGPAPRSLLRRVTDAVFSWKASEEPKLLPAIVLSVVILFGYQWFFQKTTTSAPASVIADLVSDARKELAAGQRDRAALLVAEAAARLDPATVVGPVGDSAKQVYEALLSLQPLLLQKDRAAGAGKPKTATISPDGRWVAVTGSQQETLVLRFPPQAQVQPSAEREIRGYSAAAFSPDSRYLATGGRNGSLVVYDIGSGRPVWRWENKNPDSAWVNAVAFSPNGNLVGAGTDTGEVVIAKVESWTELRIYPPAQARNAQAQGILAVAFSPDSLYLAAGGESPAVRWLSYQQERPVESLGPHKGPVRTIVFAPPGPDRISGRSAPNAQQAAPVRSARRVATASGDGFVYLWTQTDNLPLKVDVPAGPDAFAVAFSRDGTLLATGGKETHLWRVADLVPGASPAPVASLGVADVRSLGFSTDGTWVATGSADRTVRLWEVSGGRELQRVTVGASVDSVTISPDSRYIVMSTAEGLYTTLVQVTGREPKLSAADVQALACSQTRETTLAADIWKRYFRAEPVRFTCGGVTGGGNIPRV